VCSCTVSVYFVRCPTCDGDQDDDWACVLDVGYCVCMVMRLGHARVLSFLTASSHIGPFGRTTPGTVSTSRKYPGIRESWKTDSN
jgi:hypothetical protein